MTAYDLLDVFEILIHIRFSLDSKESLQLVALLIEALHIKLGNILKGQYMQPKFIRNYILNSEKAKNIKLGTFDNHYPIENTTANEANVIFAFLIIMSSIKEKLSAGEYSEAFSIVDSTHNYPIDLLTSKKNAKKVLLKTAAKLLNNF